MTSIAIGRLLRANTSGCVIGCQVSQSDAPVFGQMVRIPLDNGTSLFGLVHEIHIDDDGLVRQLVTAAAISEEVIEDNRKNRNMPLEMSVAFIGWEKDHIVSQTHIPYPPLSLTKIYLCSEEEMVSFVQNGKFAYLRPLLRNQEIPSADLLTAHIRQMLQALQTQTTPPEVQNALREVISLLRDDYPQLMDVLSAVSEVLE